MAIGIYTERTTVVELEEEYGVIMRLCLEHLVAGLTDATGMGVLNTALSTVNSYNMPNEAKIIGSTLSDMRLVKRTARLVPNDPQKVIVRLTYERNEAQNQIVDEIASEGGGLVVQMSSTATGKTTNVDKDGNAITVSYTQTFGAGTGNEFTVTRTQGANLAVDDVQEIIMISGVWEKSSLEAMTLAHTLVNKVNSIEWANREEQTWRCMNFETEPIATKIGGSYFGKLIRFRANFQYNREGWQPRATYIDPYTGVPPVDLVEGVGMLDVNWYDTIDFNTYFNLAE